MKAKKVALAPLLVAGAWLVLGPHSGCNRETTAGPTLHTPCPNEYPTPGATCPEAGLACSYASSCVSYYRATCRPDLTWDVELPQCGHGGYGGGGGLHAGGSGLGGDVVIPGGAGGTGNSGNWGGWGGWGGAGGGLACDDAGDPNCTDPTPCVCVGCNDDGTCSGDDDCTCADCLSVCGDSCDFNGVCSPYNEGCLCDDCLTIDACL